jgi:uncharacterized protein (DUF342 family)
MALFTVSLSSDGLRVYLQVPPHDQGAYPTIAAIRLRLQEQGVCRGINESAIGQAVMQRIYNRRILIAEGTPARPGTPGRMELLVDTASRGKPREREDGSVDLRDLRTIIFVHEGDMLVRHVVPVASIPGATVRGREIGAPTVGDAPFIAGPGTRISDTDPNVLVAAHDGDLVIDSDNTVSVVKAKIVQGDIDYAVGSIEFEGDVRVLGTVRKGFGVSSEGRVSILGNIEDATVNAAGDVDIQGGAIGADDGTVRSGGSVSAHHVEHIAVKAIRDVRVMEDIVYGDVKAGGSVHARGIIGGTVSVRELIAAATIGCAAEIRTVVELNSQTILRDEKAAIEVRRDRSAAALTVLKYDIVRKGMNEEGVLKTGDEAKLISLRMQNQKHSHEGRALCKRLKALDEILRIAPASFIRAERVFPNTVIRNGATEKTVRAIMRDVVITVRGAAIIDSKSGKELP